MHLDVKCVFEPIDDTSLRLILLEADDEHGGRFVRDIIEFEPAARGAKSIATGFLARSGLPFKLTFATRWDVDVARCRTNEGRIAKIIAAYPGAGASTEDYREFS